MSWEDFDVFYSAEDNINKIKQCAFVYNHINVYIARLCDWVQEKSEYKDMAEWLITNDILRIPDTVEQINVDLHDKVFYTADKKLLGLIHHNKKKLANPPKYPKHYQKILNEIVQKDINDEFLNELIINEYRREFNDELKQNYYWDITFSSSSIPEELKRTIKDEIDKIWKIKEAHYRRHIEVSHRLRNLLIVNQFSSSHSAYIDPYSKFYYDYKVSGYRDFSAIRHIRGAESMLPLTNHNIIDEFSFDDIIEIRKNGTRNEAMKKLSEIIEQIPYAENTEEFEKQVREKIQDTICEVIESQRGSPIKDTIKSIVNLGVSFIPVVGQIVGAGKTISDPLISYLKDQTKKRCLAYFYIDLRNFTKE